MYETEVGIPRHGAGPREVARAGEIWRLFQEVAMRATTAAGWPPARYLAEGTSFVIYGLAGVHHREVAYGERLRARTWVYDFKRGTLTRRQIRLADAAGPVASCTQQWVHTDAALRPVRASDALLAAFPAELPDEPAIFLPDYEALPPGPAHAFAFDAWHTWMDPLAHVNHPAYVDFCDEGTARAVAAAGLDPQALVPVAEELAFKAGAVAGQRVEVQTRLVGRTADGAAVLEHVVGGDGAFARGRTVRRHLHADLCAVLR